MKKLPWLLVVLLSAVLVCSIRTNVRLTNYSNVYTDTLTVLDTIPYYHPVPKDTLIVRYKYVTIPAAPQDTTAQQSSKEIQIVESTPDSTKLSIPISQHRYSSDEYCAYISGYGVSMDSIFVFPKHTVINKVQRVKPGRWGVGVQVGVGVCGNKVSPYFGIGVSYNLFSW